MNAFFDGIAAFFIGLTPAASLLLAIIGLLIFTLGLLLGWLIQKRVTRQLAQQLRLLQTERDLLTARSVKAEEERAVLARELEIVSGEKVQVLDRLHLLQAAEKRNIEQITELSNTVETLAASKQSPAELESLKAQISSLQVQNEQLQAELAGAVAGAGEGASAATPTAELPDYRFDPYQPSIGPSAADADDEANYENLSELERRLQFLEDRLATLAPDGNFTTAPSPEYSDLYDVSPVATDAAGEPLVIRADTARPGVRYAEDGEAEVVVQTTPSLQEVPELPDPATQDDLTRIHRIGPFLQRQLNAVDVYRYEQIAAWTAADVATYTDLIGYLPGIIERDNWVGQAKLAAAGKLGELRVLQEERKGSVA